MKIQDFVVDETAIDYLGSDLVRPECVVADSDGSLWVSDGRGGITHILKDGSQKFIPQTVDGENVDGSLPNGLAKLADGNFAVANMGSGRLEQMSRSGETLVLCDTINGAPLGLVNFVLFGPDDNLWFTVSSRQNEFMDGFRYDIADGYIGLFDGTSAKIVADNLSFPNEIRFDAAGDYIYVAETTGKRIRRMKVLGVEGLGEPEEFGPVSLGEGFPDGIAFDADGNLWVAMVVAEKIIVITPDQLVHTVLDAGVPSAIEEVENSFMAGTLNREQMGAAKGGIAPLTSSVAFGGGDLKTVYLGCLAGNKLASFHSPIPGQAMPHWQF